MTTEKGYMVIRRGAGSSRSYFTPTPELFDKESAEKFAGTIASIYEPRVVTAAEYLQICQSFKEAA